MLQGLVAVLVVTVILRDCHYLTSRTNLVVLIQTRRTSSTFAQAELQVYIEVALA